MHYKTCVTETLELYPSTTRLALLLFSFSPYNFSHTLPSIFLSLPQLVFRPTHFCIPPSLFPARGSTNRHVLTLPKTAHNPPYVNSKYYRSTFHANCSYNPFSIFINLSLFADGRLCRKTTSLEFFSLYVRALVMRVRCLWSPYELAFVPV